MRKKLFAPILLLMVFSIYPKTIAVPQGIATLQAAIYSARCGDTISCVVVRDNATINFVNKGIYFLANLGEDTGTVSINVSLNIGFSKCVFEGFNILGTPVSAGSTGSNAITATSSQLNFIHCALTGASGGGSSNCSSISGGAGLFLNKSTARFSNVMIKKGAQGGIPGNCICVPPSCHATVQPKPTGLVLIDSSVVDTAGLSGDSVGVDSTSSLKQLTYSWTSTCPGIGTPEEPFTDMTFTNYGSLPEGGTINCVDYNNDNKYEIAMTYRTSGAVWEYSLVNQGDWNFTYGSGVCCWGTGINAEWADFDNDGDLDYLKGATVAANGFYRPSSSAFLRDLFGAFSTFGDFNNDGKLDILEIGDTMGGSFGTGSKTILWQSDTSFSHFKMVPSSIMQFYTGTAAWGDYDKDGDMDLLITGCDINHFNGITKIYRNDDGVLVELPDTLAGCGPYAFACFWADIDNDGQLEAVVGGKIYKYVNGRFVLSPVSMPRFYPGYGVLGDFDNDGDLDLFTTGDVCRNDIDSFTYIHYGTNISGRPSGVDCADLDNDGTLDFCVVSDGGTKFFRNNCTKKNTPPSVPQNLRSSISGNVVTLAWDPSTDAETPSKALTYDLRVGTTLNGCEVMSTRSDPATGFRRVPGMGNTCLTTFWKLKNLNQGQYYWSVQAVDNGYMGSAFAPTQNFAVGPVGAFAQASQVRASVRFVHRIGSALYVENLPAHVSIEAKIFNVNGEMVKALQFGNNETSKTMLPLRCRLSSGVYLINIKVISSDGFISQIKTKLSML